MPSIRPQLQCLVALLVILPSSGLAKEPPITKEEFVQKDGPQTAPRLSPSATVLASYSFDNGSLCDAQGWTGHDRTLQPGTFFHVENFFSMGLNYQGNVGVLAGSKSMWCGARPSAGEPFCGYATLPGYGHNWDQSLVTKTCITTGPATTLSFLADWDTEFSYDFIVAEYTTDCTGATGWTIIGGGPGIWEGNRTETDPIVVAVPDVGPAKVRIRFTSDGAWSDEDGLYDTDGAIAIDNLALTGLATEDFEGEVVGATQANDWEAIARPGYGNFAGLQQAGDFPGTASNPSCGWGFLTGTSASYACAGFPGVPAIPYIVNDEGIWNEARSPEIPLTGSGSQLWLRFDVFTNLPLNSLVFYQWQARFKSGGCWSKWQGPNLVYYGAQNAWLTREVAFGNYSPVPLASVTHVQVSLAVRDMCPTWCGIFGDGACHSFAPLFDNVVITRGTPGTISGRMYIDVAGNCVFDVGTDTAVSGRTVVAQPSGVTAVTNASGNYTLTLPDGNHTIMRLGVANDPYIVQPCQSGSYSIALAEGQTVTDTDFALKPVGTITGRAYLDVGGSCVYNDGIDVPIASRLILVNPGGYQAYTKGDGTYSITLPIGAYTVTQAPVANDPWALQGCQAASYNVNVTNGGTASGRDFALQHSGVPHCEVEAYIVSSGFNTLPPPCARLLTKPCPGIEHEYLFVVKNEPTSSQAIPAGATVDMTLDAKFSIGSVTSTFPLTLVSSIGNQRTVALDSPLNPGQVCVVTVRVTPNTGGIYTTQMTFDDAALCTGPKSDVLTERDACSCDPNDKAVTPAGCGPNGTVTGEEPFTYKIQFENLGPGTAYDVTIEDELDADLDPGSVTLLTSSHNVTGLQFNPGNVVVFRMDGIELPGTYDTANNKGYIVFSASTYPNPAEGTVIENTASIVFDENEPVVTNTVINTISSILCPTGVSPAPVTLELGQNRPNPFNPVTMVPYSTDRGGHVSLKVYTIKGELVRTLVDRSMPAGEHVAQWDGRNNLGENLASGVYFYRLVSGERVLTRKAVLLK